MKKINLEKIAIASTTLVGTGLMAYGIYDSNNIHEMKDAVHIGYLLASLSAGIGFLTKRNRNSQNLYLNENPEIDKMTKESYKELGEEIPEIIEGVIYNKPILLGDESEIITKQFEETSQLRDNSDGEVRECIIYHRGTGEQLFHGNYVVGHPSFREYFPREETYVMISKNHGGKLLTDDHDY
ncbi:MAG: hypothetical protein A2596_04050 [Candidatus Levybacteria bacterium RIFOXYD1_FULL_40_21]|nr:MAG: hypothetical protein A2596_04050 [Candidatus Levybacteria bacterium RIFOXYD1_FULL_40_21]HLA23184.1 hypothetical protein [Candidatus Nanoarchaeia archaeon]